MEVKRTRPYKSEQRTRQAEETRRRILDVAERLFARDGYAAVSMAEVARHAEVSVANIYLHFPGKAAVVKGMADAITAAPDLSVERFEQEPDPVTKVRLGAQIMRTLNERSWVVSDVLRTARAVDADLGTLWKEWQRRHEHAIRRSIVSLDSNGHLRPGSSVDDATAAFMTLAGTDVYRTLIEDHGWTADRYEAWLFRLGCTELLGIFPDSG
jgi:TetR/AcrR family transcriptional regulator, regulator of cefoperazone and chloramphenicol sensitivity